MINDNKSKLIFQKNYNKLLETIHINKIKNRHYSSYESYYIYYG
jgi:hypothetical protein